MANPFLSSEDFDERAHQLYDAGDYDEALAVLQEGLRRFPSAVDLHVGLGYVRLAREEFVWARHSFEEALALEPEHEDGWVGLGEVLLKFGEADAAFASFAHVDDLGFGDDLELGLTIGRALYREGLLQESEQRLADLAAVHPESGEVRAALGYTLHALGDEAGAYRELSHALHCDSEFHEARIYLSHLLYERGDFSGSLRELERVPPAEHWDPLSLWRLLDLKSSIDGLSETDPRLQPWRQRIAELHADPDPIDHLLAEVESRFEETSDELLPALGGAEPSLQRSLPWPADLGGEPQTVVHRVRTPEGELFTGTWAEIVHQMRDAHSHPGDPIRVFMSRAAQRVRRLTGEDLPCEDPEAFLRGSAALGLLHIED